MQAYDNRDDGDEARALVRRNINSDLCDLFELKPVVLSEFFHWCVCGLQVIWGVYVDDVWQGFVYRSRSGRQTFLSGEEPVGGARPYTAKIARLVEETRVKEERHVSR